MSPKRFLVAEDDAGVRTLLVALLHICGVEATETDNGRQAIECLRRARYDGVILDLMMPEANGFEVLSFLRAERPHMLPATIVVTAAAEATLRHFDVGSIRVLIRKPFNINDLMGAVTRIATSAEGAGETPPLTVPAPLR